MLPETADEFVQWSILGIFHPFSPDVSGHDESDDVRRGRIRVTEVATAGVRPNCPRGGFRLAIARGVYVCLGVQIRVFLPVLRAAVGRAVLCLAL